MQSERASSSGQRLIIDLSSTARWTGPPVGILRAERELAAWALHNVPSATFVFFDPAKGAFREISPDWVRKMLKGRAIIDPWGLPAGSPFYPSRRDRIPQAIRPWADWVLQFRRSVLRFLERQRLTRRSPRAKAFIDRVQRAAMSDKYRRSMVLADGARRDLAPADLLLGEAIDFRPEDILFCAGNSWAHLNIHALRALKERHGFSLALLCYDIIPLLHPETYKPHDVAAFEQHYAAAFPAADLVIFNSKCVEQDARAYCGRNHLPIKATAVCALGADVRGEASVARELPDGLEEGRYVLFVSTIEPRKGHGLLYRVWLRLLAQQIPQAHGFKLVLVGRPGWMVDDLLHQLKTDERLAGTIRLLSNLEDDMLASLYRGAAFCVYPSLYEGYGLPVVEAFQFGKAVIASTGGSLPEVVNGLSPCLDPRDEDLWCAVLGRWIEDKSARTPFEEAIRTQFRHPTWSEACKRIFEEIEALRHKRAAPAHDAARAALAG